MSNLFDQFSARSHTELPKMAKIIEVGLGVQADGRIQLAMTGYTDLDKCPTENDFAAQIAKYVSDPCGRPPLTPFGKQYPDDACFKANDMSLRLGEAHYLVYHLKDSLSWAFSRNFAPFTQDAEITDKEIFSAPRLINGHGELLPNGKFADDCRFAAFIFTPPANRPADYVFRFNLHIELLENPSDPDNSAYIPLIIDPDVRWPGGKG
jgi:hypothetical protein